MPPKPSTNLPPTIPNLLKIPPQHPIPHTPLININYRFVLGSRRYRRNLILKLEVVLGWWRAVGAAGEAVDRHDVFEMGAEVVCEEAEQGV